MKARRAIAVVLLALAAWQFGGGLYIYAKAYLAQHLIAHAWAKSLTTHQPVKPWPWSDMWPIARLQVPSHDVEVYVLSDATGRSLAFGPGHLSGTALPGSHGNAVIAGHRDTHFGFMRNLKVGTELVVETRAASSHRYVVRDQVIFDSDKNRLAEPNDVASVTLITCYPFDAIIPGGPMRYALTAILDGG